MVSNPPLVLNDPGQAHHETRQRGGERNLPRRARLSGRQQHQRQHPGK